MKILDVVKKKDISKIQDKEEMMKLRKAAATLTVDEAIELSDVAESQIYTIATHLNKRFKHSKFVGKQRKIGKNKYRAFILRVK
jgi:hypothetical protein